MSLLSAQFSYGGCSPSRPCQTPEKQALYYYVRARILLTVYRYHGYHITAELYIIAATLGDDCKAAEAAVRVGER